MKGTRPLNNQEIRLVSACFDGNPFGDRNRGLFMLSVSTGGRISELLSLTIGDVYQIGVKLANVTFSPLRYIRISGGTDPPPPPPRRCSSLKKEADATLFLELALRGYDLSKLHDDEMTAEIVKIAV